MNPAVTIGVLAAGDAAGYVVAQLIGGVVGALSLAAVLGGVATTSARLHFRTISRWVPPPSTSHLVQGS
jgi:glycerol uptake facilitator-like aquaporin